MTHSKITSQNSRKRRLLRFLVICPVALIVALSCWWWISKHNAEIQRAQWKNQAVVQLANLSFTAIRDELRELGQGRWTHQHVVKMTNGEAILYLNRHGYNNGFVDHLFLGRGSNGKWYYTTYHFCHSMARVMGEDPPGSIAEFAARYSAREFDRKSDDCLTHTWPGR